MKKLNFVFLFFVALLAWHFVTIKTIKTVPQISVSAQSLTVFAQTSTASTKIEDVWLTTVLNGKNNLNGTDTAWFNTLYSFSRGLLNIIMLAFLVYVAIRNILNIGIESYTIKKILPKLIFAAFLGNLIRPIVAIGSKVLDSIIQSDVTIFQTPATWSWYGAIAGQKLSLFNGVVPGAWGLLAVVFAPALAGNVGLILLLFGVVVNILLLGGMLLMAVFQAIRPWVVLLAVVAGPIAIGLSILPETESVFKKWYKILLFWLALPLILNALNYVIGLVPSMRGNEGTGFLSSVVGTILPLFIKIGLYAMAVRLPFTWEKDIGGMIAALPGTIASTTQKTLSGADKVNKAVGGEVVLQGRKWENKLRQDTRRKAHDGSIDMARGLAEDKYGKTDEANRREITQYETVNYLEDLKKPENQARTRDIFGNTPINAQRVLAMYEKYQNGDLVLDGSNKEHEAARDYFGNHVKEREIKAKSKDDYIKDHTEKIQSKAAQSAEDTLQAGKGPGGKWFSLFRGAQTWSTAGISNALAARSEFRAGEIKKAAFRFDVIAKAVAGNEVDVKSQNARKDGDFAQLYSSDQVDAEASRSREKAARIFQKLMEEESGVAVSLEQAKVALMRELERLDRAAESTYVYNSSLLGKKAFTSKDEIEKIDSNDLGTLIAGHNRTKTLAASEARSTKSIEEQKFIREQRVTAAYLGSSGASASASATNARVTVNPDTTQLTAGDRLLNASLLKLDRRLAKTSSGIAAISTSRDQLAGEDLSNISDDEFSRYRLSGEEGLLDLGRLLAQKKDQPTADKFINDLRIAKGLDTPAMIQRAENEFGKDPNIEDQIVEYGARQLLELEVTTQSENIQSLRVVSGQLAMKQAANPQVAREVKKSLEVFVKSESGDRSISPEQALAARKYIATQAGLSDPNGINLGMIQNLARASQITTYTNPEAE